MAAPVQLAPASCQSWLPASNQQASLNEQPGGFTQLGTALCSRLLNLKVEDYKLWAWVIEITLVRGG